MEDKLLLLGNEKIKALDPRWAENVNFLPYVREGEYKGMVNEAERIQVLETIEEDLNWLLRLPHNRFWSQVLFDPTLQGYLDSYLRYAPRNYDEQLAQTLFSIKSQADIRSPRSTELEDKIARCSFFVFLRLSTFKESASDYMKPETFAEIIYENWIFDIPKMLDICVLFGRKYRPLVSKMLENIFKTQPKYWADFDEMLKSMEPLLSKISEQTKAPTSNKSEDVLFYVCDIVFTLNAFVSVFPQGLSHLVQNHILSLLSKVYTAIEALPHAPLVLPQIVGLLKKIFVLGIDYMTPDLAKAFVVEFDSLFLQEGCFLHLSETALEEMKGLLSALKEHLGDKVDHVFQYLAMYDASTASSSSSIKDGVQTGPSSTKQPGFGSSSTTPGTSSSTTVPSTSTIPAPTSSEVEQGVEMLRSMFPELLRETLLQSLLDNNGNLENAISQLLDAAPSSSSSSSSSKPVEKNTQNEASKPQPSSLVSSRRNIYDGDAFDVFGGKALDPSRVHIGKKTVESFDSLVSDKSFILANMDAYLYEDEYDDTYDGVAVAQDSLEEDPLPPNPNHAKPLKVAQAGTKEGRGPKDAANENGNGDDESDGDEEGEEEDEESSEGEGDASSAGGFRGGRGGFAPRGGRGNFHHAPPETLRDKQIKDRHKASRANHNRKRGADHKRKMGMGYLPPSN